MANRLEFFADLNASGFAAGIATMERLSATASLRLNNTLEGFNSGKRSNRSASKDYEDRLERKAAGKAAYEKKMQESFIGPMATLEQMASLNGGKAAAGFWSKFTRGLQGHGSGGMAQLIHVFRATFDSLASGMSPWRVLLQQAPQALQAFASMSGATLAKIISVVFSPMALIAAGATAIGGIFWLWSSHLRHAAESAHAFAASFFKSRGDLEKQADEIKRLADNMRAVRDAAEEYAYFLDKLAQKQETLTDKTQAVIAAMRKRFDLEQQTNPNQTTGEKLAAEQSQRQKELGYLSAAQTLAEDTATTAREKADAAEKELEAAKASAKVYADAMSAMQQGAQRIDKLVTDFKTAHPEGLVNWWSEVKNNLSGNDKAMDALQAMQWLQKNETPPPGMELDAESKKNAAFARSFINESGDEQFKDSEGNYTTVKTLMATWDDLVARAKISGPAGEEATRNLQKLGHALETAKEVLTTATTDKSAISKIYNETKDDIGLHKEFDPKIATAKKLTSVSTVPRAQPDALVRTGNFLGSARGQIKSLATEQVRIARNTYNLHKTLLPKIEENTRKRSGGSYSVN